MAFKPCNYDYSKMHSCDVIFTHGCDPIGAAIRLGEKLSWNSLTNRKMPNHAGILFDICGQFFAMELTPRGPDITSIEKYRGKGSQIIYVWRYSRFEDAPVMDEARIYLATWMRRKQESGYDLWGAIRASTWARKLLPFLKNNKTEFCSENTYQFLKKFGLPMPLDWVKYPPNPLQLWDYLKCRSDGKVLQGWKT